MKIKKDFDVKCDSKGQLKNMTITKAQKRGRSKLLKRVRDQELVIFATDKSGKIAILDKGLYWRLPENTLVRITWLTNQ